MATCYTDIMVTLIYGWHVVEQSSETLHGLADDAFRGSIPGNEPVNVSRRTNYRDRSARREPDSIFRQITPDNATLNFTPR